MISNSPAEPAGAPTSRSVEQRFVLVDDIAERVQSRGGVVVVTRGTPPSSHPLRAPVEGASGMLSRFLEGYEGILTNARDVAAGTLEPRDDGTQDLLVSQVIHTDERQVWFLVEGLVETPLVQG
jgi:starvation-inducible DNA-binding protein